MYRARNVMNTNVVTIQEDATAQDAIRTLVEHNVSGCPVVNAQGSLVGIISEAQLLVRIFRPEAKDQPVGDVMTKDVVTVDEDALLSDIAITLVMKRIHRIPVVRDGEVVGIVSRRDLLRYIVETGEELDEFLENIRALA